MKTGALEAGFFFGALTIRYPPLVIDCVPEDCLMRMVCSNGALSIIKAVQIRLDIEGDGPLTISESDYLVFH